ncbi:hypothetical protein EOM57_02765 [Candidatus Saccharibacteria bacterium]|nr:hypothetical protein [Candidatus Saccharibacteria bacterium]
MAKLKRQTDISGVVEAIALQPAAGSKEDIVKKYSPLFNRQAGAATPAAETSANAATPTVQPAAETAANAETPAIAATPANTTTPTVQPAVETAANATAPAAEPPELIDIDLSEFIFTGIIKHTFSYKIGKHQLDVVLRLMTTREQNDYYREEWNLREDNISVRTANTELSTAIISRALVSYGPEEFTGSSDAEKREFVETRIPSFILADLVKKYLSLEYSAASSINSENIRKN